MKYFRIGDLAKICEVNVKTIRFYEEKGLLLPVYVDEYTGYRYYNQTSSKRLLEILMFKKLGFSLKEIKNLNVDSVDSKISSLKNQIKKTQANIIKLEQIIKKDGKTMNDLNIFVNDEQVIGKWKILKSDDLPYKEIYFLPEGKPYWVFKGWTKGYLKIFETYHRYEIVNEELLIYIKDINGIEGKCVKYEKVDNKHYDINDIKVIDDISYVFENDEDVIGCWKAIDFLEKIDVKLIQTNQKELYLKRMIFIRDGTVIFECNDGSINNRSKWTKGKVIEDYCDKISSTYKIITIDKQVYLFFEWKSGDYTFGKREPKYYVFIKE